MSSKDNMDPRIEELLPFYVLDALTEEEKDQVESYLAKHPEARPQVQELRSGASALPYGVSPVEPPRHVKEALMARVQADVRARGSSLARTPSSTSTAEASQPVRRGIRFDDIFRVLSLGAAVAAIVWAFVLNAQVVQLQNEIASLHTQVAQQSKTIDEVIESIRQKEDIITVSLKSTGGPTRTLGQLIANPNDTSAVVLISGLPPLEPGKTYQVWLIGNAPVSAGLLTVNENGQSVLIITSTEAIGSFNSLGISIEPQGGSEQPTGDIVVLSEL